MNHKLFIILFTILMSAPLPAQNSQDSLENYFIAIPLVYRTPETSWAFGAGAAYNYYLKNDTLGNRPSQLQFGAVYTLKEQILIYLPYQIYFRNNALNFNGELGYYRYVYFFYGIGNKTLVENEETYLSEYPRFKWEGLYGLTQNFFIGLTYDWDAYNIIKTEQNGILEDISPVGRDGGIVSEPGLIALYDGRDNVFYPNSGEFAQFDLYGGWLGTFEKYIGWKWDLKKYVELPWEHTIAMQWYWENQYGQVPFFRLASLGGPKLLRGYIEGRFRDKKMNLWQFSYRLPLFWRFKLVAFSSYGVVDEKNFFPILDGHFSYGLGLRVLADRDNKLHVRLDYARGADQQGFYLTIGEAF